MQKPLESLTKHRRFVSVLRVLFPSVAFALLASLLIWPQVVKKTDFVSQTLKQSVRMKDLKAKIDMTKVQFFSQDDKGQPFTITSDKIIEQDENVVHIDKPLAKMTLSSGIELNSQSGSALMYQDTQKVFFPSKIFVNSSNGYNLVMADVSVDHKQQQAFSKKAFKLRGEKIDLDCIGFNMRQNGQEVDFFAPVQAILKEDDKKVVITADKVFEVRQRTQTISAYDKVALDDGTNQVFCDEMTAYFKKVGNNQYKLKSIQAQGHIVILTQTEKIKGNNAFYDLIKGKSFITGNVEVERSEGVMYGDRAIVDMITGKSQLEVDETKKNGRVRGRLFPSKINRK